MWRPLPYKRLGSKHRLGQILPQSAVDQAARTVVDLAEPRVRAIITDERLRIANAGKAALPFIALSTAGFFATSFWATKGKVKVLGYAASAAALGIGLWLGFETLGGEAPPPPPPPSGPDIPFVSETGRQLARSVVAEALPVIQNLVEEERTRFSTAITTMIPYMAASAAGTVLTIFAVPSSSEGLKVAGYTASAGALLIGLWHGLETLAE